MNTQNTMLDFDNLPDDVAVEDIVNQMDGETCLQMLNMTRARQIAAAKEDTEISESEIRAGILIARRFRSLRETKKVRGQAKLQKSASLTDLLQGI